MDGEGARARRRGCPWPWALCFIVFIWMPAGFSWAWVYIVGSRQHKALETSEWKLQNCTIIKRGIQATDSCSTWVWILGGGGKTVGSCPSTEGAVDIDEPDRPIAVEGKLLGAAADR